MLTLGSLFDGIGGRQLAARRAGVTETVDGRDFVQSFEQSRFKFVKRKADARLDNDSFGGFVR